MLQVVRRKDVYVMEVPRAGGGLENQRCGPFELRVDENKAAMTFRHGTLITHHRATYIPSPLIPGFTGHVPTTKFMCGDTFGKASMKYSQEVRSASMGCRASEDNKGGMFPSISSNNRALISRNHHHQQNKYPASHLTHGARYNVNFKRQEEIKLFNQLAQKHRENYKDKTGTRYPLSSSILPGMEDKKYL